MPRIVSPSVAAGPTTITERYDALVASGVRDPAQRGAADNEHDEERPAIDCKFPAARGGTFGADIAACVRIFSFKT